MKNFIKDFARTFWVVLCVFIFTLVMTQDIVSEKVASFFYVIGGYFSFLENPVVKSVGLVVFIVLSILSFSYFLFTHKHEELV